MMEIPLSRGLVALVDAEDFDSIVSRGSWYADPCCSTHYARRNETYVDIEGVRRWRSIKMHRLLTGWDLVDHINGNGLDNRRSNLRPATPTQNAMNRRIRSDNTSGFKGVRLVRNKWTATIQVDGKRLHLGTFRVKEDAAKSYDEAARVHFGEFASLNFPNDGEIAA